MYFWNVAALKSQLAGRGLTSSDSIKYLFGFVFLILANSRGVEFRPSSSVLGYIEVMDQIAAWIVVAMGTLYCYYENGGTSGRAFLERYLFLSWVLAWRVTAASICIFVPLWTAFALLMRAEPRLGEVMPIVAVVFHLGMKAVYYLRIGVHIEDVAQRTETRP